MLIYLLKSGACLAIFMAFYTFFLERENMHVFKRYYLLAALIIAFAIPLVTFTHYIEVAPVPTSNEPMEAMGYYTDDLPQIQETKYLPIALWSIYGIGVLVFGVKFLINLLQIIFKINRNPKQKSKHIIHVLLSDLITPHTFFKYIFLNKQKFENHDIPQAVFWHEETHAKQKHSIDVLIIELLQVIFWFNPLIYFTKQAIKMNHEFLADQAVLNKGIMASNYQHMLLAFSSNATEPQLANAINYSSIKKRFTVMKTQTSKRNMWLKSILILPLLALTLYGFSEKREVVNQETSKNNTHFVLIMAQTNDVIINGRPSSISTFKNDLNAITKDWNDSDFKTVVPDLQITSCSQEYLYNLDLEFRKTDYFLKSLQVLNFGQQKATPEEIAEYNKLAKHYNTQTDDNRVIKMKDMKRIKELYDKMTTDQKTNAEPMPNFPPPPPPPTKDGSRNEAFVNQTISPPPPPPANASEKQKKAYQKALEAYKIERESYTYKQTNPNGKVIDITVIPENDGMVPPPPPPPPPAPVKEKSKVLETNTNKNIVLLEHWYITIDNNKYYYPYNKGDLKKYYDQYGNEVPLDIVKEYNKKYDLFEKLKNEGQHYIYKTEKSKKEIDQLYSDLGGMYFRMTKANKTKISTPKNPYSPYIKLTKKTGEIYYKKSGEFTEEDMKLMPPPPTLPSKKN